MSYRAYQPVYLTLEKGVLRDFQQRALDRWPNEHLEFLVGTWSRGIAHVECSRPCKLVHSSARGCTFNYEDRDQIIADALADGLLVVGDLHTHPFTWKHHQHYTSEIREDLAWPSATDWLEHQGKRYITGIARVLEWPSRRKTWKFKFFGPLVPVRVLGNKT